MSGIPSLAHAPSQTRRTTPRKRHAAAGLHMTPQGVVAESGDGLRFDVVGDMTGGGGAAGGVAGAGAVGGAAGDEGVGEGGACGEGEGVEVEGGCRGGEGGREVGG